MPTHQTFDVAVIGAGVFGAWTAYQLAQAGAEVVLVDSYGPGNSRASSGGESRVIRMGYGADQIYTRMAQRSFALWQEVLGASGLFQSTGVLWLARENDSYCEATVKSLELANVRFEKLNRSELQQRYPQLELGPVGWGILEPDSGVLLARRAVQFVVEKARAHGVTYLEEAVVPQDHDHAGSQGNGVVSSGTNVASTRLSSVKTRSGKLIRAQKFVFACGPWLPKLFSTLLADLIYVTRQEVFFFGVPPGDTDWGPERMPAWIDFKDLIYGIPNLDGRGVKIAIDEHGPQFDPDSGERIVSAENLARVRAFLRQRLPRLAAAPVTETRVCQYENTSNGDFLIDRHPALENVWLVGGGSGHGFKHGPAVGEHVAALFRGGAVVEPRFSLRSKKKVQQREVY